MWNNWNKVNEMPLGVLTPVASVGPSRIATENWAKWIVAVFSDHHYKETV